MNNLNANQSTNDSVARATFTIPQHLLAPQPNQTHDEIDLVELFKVLWAGKFIIILISAVFAVASIFYALAQPNIYKASVLLSPANSDGGLASLAGVNLGGGGSDKTVLALDIIKSRSFIEFFITKHKLLVPLMAAKGWDIESNTLI